MKPRNRLLVCVAVIATLSACREAVDYYDPITADEYRQAQYASVFKKVFGEIDPNHNWGFGTSNSQNVSKAVFANAFMDETIDFSASNANWTSRNGYFAHSFTRSSDVAAQAASVIAYTPTYASAPEIPEELGVFYETKKEVYNPGTDYESSREWEEIKSLCTGQSYVITADNYDKIKNSYFPIDSSEEGYIDIYISEGVDCKMLNTGGNNSRIRYFVMPGASLETESSFPAAVYNWGTFHVSSDINGLVENYGTITFANDAMKLGGTLYTNKSLTAQISGANGGHLYVDGDYDTNGSFGHSGTLYVSGTMSGDININNGLAAHVGSINTTGTITVTSGSQLMVEGDVTASSMKLDGEWGGAVEAVFKGTTNISGDVNIASGTKASFVNLTGESFSVSASDFTVAGTADFSGEVKIDSGTKASFVNLTGESFTASASDFIVADTADISGDVNIVSGTKGYFENLNCANYIAAASDITIGCSLKLPNGMFKLNGDSYFTLAAGAYLHAKEAEFSSNTMMTMYSNAFFKVDEKLQLNNADTNKFYGADTEFAIVKANTIGSNYEDFSNTFTGNIGVDFEAWAYDTSTNLINDFKNLPTVTDLVANGVDVTIPESTCNPSGYTPTPPVKTVNYTVYYKIQGTDIEIAARVTGSGKVDETINVIADGTIVYEGETYVTENTSASLTLVDGTNEYTFWYNKKTKPEPQLIACYRVFAEDLGDMVSDFDFNDIVFDVIHYGDANQGEDEETEIILQAAGGTIYSEIQVGTFAIFPVHGTFGVGDQVMVNTFTSAQGTMSADKYSTCDPVQLANPDATNGRYPGHLNPADVKIFVEDGAAEAYEILSRQGQAAGKVCVTGDRPEDLPKWSPEYINIRNTYPKFSDYVKDALVIWWK